MADYYHGGPAGLSIGDKLLPPKTTGRPSTAQYGAAGVCDPSKVYITPDPTAAAMFAAMNADGIGAVYRVRPWGEIAHDPDCSERGLSYSCDGAVILGRVRIRRKTLAKIRKAMLMEGGV